MKKTEDKIRKGYKPSPFGPIPSDWNILLLGSLVHITSGISPSLYTLAEKGKFPYLKVEDLNNCNKYQKKSREYTNDKKGIVPENSIIFPKRGAAILNNKVRISFAQMAMDSNLMAIYPKSKNELNVEFLYYRITFEQLHKIADTSTIPQINNKHLTPYKFLLPSINEQIVIACCLATWDNSIETITQLVTQKELRKKWMTQQLFTGKRRLEGFKEEWKEAKISDLFNEIKCINDGDKTHCIMTISSRSGFVSQQSKFDRVIAGDSLKKYTQLSRGDFAYNKGNSKTYPMGCIYQLEEKSALVPFVYICFSPTNKINSAFYGQWFLAHGLDSQLNKIITSGARGDGLLNVNTEDFFRLKVPFPTKDEQAAIAKVLQVADKEIEVLKRQLAKLKEQKKGLMQQLLTGRKRLLNIKE
jgi:type I restriction enzyme S subunit